jgi:hypothetical protein
VHEEFGVYMKLLDIFDAWLVWACGCRARLVLYSSFGLKQILGNNGLGWVIKSCCGWVGCV